MTDPTAPLDDIDALDLRLDLAEWNLAVLLEEADQILTARVVYVRALGDRGGGR